MTDEIKPEEWIGPMNQVESMLLQGEGSRHSLDIKNLKEVIRNLEASLVSKKRELSDFEGRRLRILREIVKGRGKDPGNLPIRSADRPNDQSVWIVLGGRPET